MKISTRGRYALRIMMDLAENFPQGKSGFIKLKDIADRQEISKSYLVQIFIALKNAGLVNSSSGQDGGYALAQSPEQIKILDIVEAGIGEISITDCLKDKTLCSRSENCRAHILWGVMNKQIRDTLASVTLDQITARECNIENLILHMADFAPKRIPINIEDCNTARVHSA